MGSVLHYITPHEESLHVYITGDTLLIDDLRAIPERFPDVDVAILHLGGTTLPGGLVVTMDADQGTALVELIDPTTAIPVHNDDYPVFRSPLSVFVSEAGRRGLGERIRVVAPGETTDLGCR